MTALLDPGIAERLAKLCGMFGSDHIGERSAAAQMADRLVKESGLTWFDVILQRLPIPGPSVTEKIRFALGHIDLLSRWEHGFLLSIRNTKRELSDKQLEVLNEIVAKAKAAAEAAQ